MSDGVKKTIYSTISQKVIWTDSDETWWMSLEGDKNKPIRFLVKVQMQIQPISWMRNVVFSLVVVCALLSAVLVDSCIHSVRSLWPLVASLLGSRAVPLMQCPLVD